MAYELVAEVLDHAPADLTPAERLVMVAIAEFVHRQDYENGRRSTSRPAVDIARRAGLNPKGLKEALSRLAKRKLELRVPLMTGKDGRPVYAVPGRSSTYEIPALPTPANCPCETCERDKPELKVVHKGRPQPPLRKKKGRSQPPLGAVTAAPGAVTAAPCLTSDDTENTQVEALQNYPQGAATTAPNRVPVPGVPGPRARAALIPTDIDIETIIEEMHDHTNRTITPDHAELIYREILKRAHKPPRHPLSYVLSAIRNEPHRHIPTSTPPPFQSGRQLPLVALAE
jgi:hypothetical protein